MKITGGLINKQLSSGTYELVDDLVFTGYVRYLDRVVTEKVRAGFLHDFASVPWAFRLWFPKQGLHSRAAILHDFLWTQADESNDQSLINSHRKYANAIFLDALIDSGVGEYKAKLMYLAVRLNRNYLRIKSKVLNYAE